MSEHRRKKKSCFIIRFAFELFVSHEKRAIKTAKISQSENSVKIWKEKGITFSNVKNSAFSLERLYRLYVSFYLILKNSSNFVYISIVPSIWRFLLNKIQICLGKFQLLLWLSGICGSSGSSGFYFLPILVILETIRSFYFQFW